jgi:hypothetical protein
MSDEYGTDVAIAAAAAAASRVEEFVALLDAVADLDCVVFDEIER